MSDARQRRFGLHGDTEPSGRGDDMAIIDPGYDDPGYWVRFRSHVMARASDELSRRSLAAEVGVADFIQSWARGVIRTAAIAAAVAGFLLLRDGPATAVGVEEALMTGLEDRTLTDSMERPGDDPFLLVEVTF
jgi:hypothetical protein